MLVLLLPGDLIRFSRKPIWRPAGRTGTVCSLAVAGGGSPGMARRGSMASAVLVRSAARARFGAGALNAARSCRAGGAQAVVAATGTIMP